MEKLTYISTIVDSVFRFNAPTITRYISQQLTLNLKKDFATHSSTISQG
jgi:hypothetical protein